MTLRIYLLPALAFLTFFLPGTKEYTNVRERTDSLRAELVRDYKPASGKERKLLLIFQKARLLRKANPDLAIKYYEQFYREAIRAKEPFYAATAISGIGRVYIDKHMYFSAIEYLLRSYQILADNNLENRSKYFLVSIGNCYFQIGLYRMAEEYYRKSTALFSITKDFHGIAVAENNIGLIKQKLNQPDSALWYFQKALEQRKKTKQPANIGHSYYYIGSAYMNLGKLAEARKYLELAIPLLYVTVDDLLLQHDYYSTLSDVYLELGKISDIEKKHNETLLNFRKACEICDTIYEQIKIPDILVAMGTSYETEKDYRLALECYRQALCIADSLNQPDLKKACFEKMIQTFIRTKQIDSVSLYCKKYKNVSDEIQAQMMESWFKGIDLALKNRELENELKMLKRRNTNYLIFFTAAGTLLLVIALISLICMKKQKNHSSIAEVEIKTRKQAEKDLEELNRELVAINAGKDLFISLMSHEFKDQAPAVSDNPRNCFNRGN